MFTRLLNTRLVLTLMTAVIVVACSSVPDIATQVSVQPTSMPTQTYVVQQGDTPLGVALQYCTDVDTLITLNAGTYPGIAEVPMKFNYGWKILVPTTCSTGGAADVTGGSSVLPATPVESASTVLPTLIPTTQFVDAGGGYFDYDSAQEIIRLTNEARVAAGLSPLTVDERLMEIARKRATEIATDWGHQGLSDDCPECGENIGKGPNRSVQSHFDGWMNSEQHHSNMMGGYITMGAARYIFNGESFAVQIFHQ